jgi:hypothetical protein
MLTTFEPYDKFHLYLLNGSLVIATKPKVNGNIFIAGMLFHVVYKKVTHFSKIRYYQGQSYGLGASDATASGRQTLKMRQNLYFK